MKRIIFYSLIDFFLLLNVSVFRIFSFFLSKDSFQNSDNKHLLLFLLEGPIETEQN